MITYTVKSMKYKTGRVEYNYKLFTLKENQKVTASCWIFYPNQKYGDNNWLVMRQTFKGDDLTDKKSKKSISKC